MYDLRSIHDVLGAHLAARASNNSTTTGAGGGGGGRQMKERGVGKPWTQHEDSLLTQAVAVYGENDNWKNVASCVPGRTNKACRKVCALVLYLRPYSHRSFKAMAALIVPDSEEDRLDRGRGPAPVESLCKARNEVVYDCTTNSWQDRRCLLEAISRGTGPRPQAGRMDTTRRSIPTTSLRETGR